MTEHSEFTELLGFSEISNLKDAEGGTLPPQKVYRLPCFTNLEYQPKVMAYLERISKSSTKGADGTKAFFDEEAIKLRKDILRAALRMSVDEIQVKFSAPAIEEVFWFVIKQEFNAAVLANVFDGLKRYFGDASTENPTTNLPVE